MSVGLPKFLRRTLFKNQLALLLKLVGFFFARAGA